MWSDHQAALHPSCADRRVPPRPDSADRAADASLTAPQKGGGRGGARGSTNLMVLGSAAVLAVYAAGFMRTKPAADRMAAESAEGSRRRPPSAEARASSAPGMTVADASANAGVNAAADAASGAVPGAAAGSAATAPTNATTVAGGVARAAGTGVTAGLAAPVAAPVAASVAASTSANANAGSAVAGSAGHDGVSAPATSHETPVVASTPVAAASTSAPVSAPTAPAAAPAAEAPAAPAAPARVGWRDGFFVGRGTSRHGDIEAMVEIKDGRIISAVISQCLTRYSCSWIAPLVPQITARQSADVDVVSGATQSSNALYYAVLQALAQAK